MKAHLRNSLWGLFMVILILSPLTLKAQNDICTIEPLRDLLDEITMAHQNKDYDTAQDLLESAIGELDEIELNCSVELVVPEDSSASVPATTDSDNSLTEDKGNGFYLVGIDIMPGRWETTGTDSDCYWARTDVDGETIANHFGIAGGTITIKDTDFQVELDGCGTAIYVENQEPILAADAEEPKESGFYTVGAEIAPGLWRSLGNSDSCYVARLDETQEIIDNSFGSAGITINIQSSDYVVEFDDCGTWEYLGQP